MYRTRVSLAFLAAFSMATSAAIAQEPLQPTQSAQLGQATPFATLGVRGAFGTPNEQLGLYVFWTRSRAEGGEKVFAIRRASSTASSNSKIEWATSFNCPGLEAVIIDLELLPMPMIDVPTVGRNDHQGPPTDGVGYSLWSRYPTWPDGFSSSIQVSSNLGTPLAEWSERLRQTTATCWSDQMPEAAGRDQ